MYLRVEENIVVNTKDIIGKNSLTYNCNNVIIILLE